MPPNATRTLLPKGPATRRVKEPPRRAAFLQKILFQMQGPRMARWATKASAMAKRPDVTFSYDAAADLYLCDDGGKHCFAHPRRLWTLFDGRQARGKKLALQYMLDHVTFAPGDWIVDAGANTGDLSLLFSTIECPVNYIGFEPSPGEFRALEANLTHNKSLLEKEAHQIALWSDDTNALTFYLKPAKGDSSVLPIKGAIDEIKVPSARLDTVLPKRRYKLLKLEAEGAEPEILEGAAGIIENFEYVSADVGFERGMTAESTLPEVTNYLLARGFEICAFNGARTCLLFRNKELAAI